MAVRALGDCADGNNDLVVATRAGFCTCNHAPAAASPTSARRRTTRRSRASTTAGSIRPAASGSAPCTSRATSRPREMYVPRKRQGRTQAWSGGMTNSNGLAFTPGRHARCTTPTPPRHRIDRYDFDSAPAPAREPPRFQQFSTDKTAPNYGGRPDGAAVDSEGAYWVAMFEGARLLRFSPDGELLHELKLPVRCPTMVAFGGADMRTLYITSARQPSRRNRAVPTNRPPAVVARRRCRPRRECLSAMTKTTVGLPIATLKLQRQCPVPLPPALSAAGESHTSSVHSSVGRRSARTVRSAASGTRRPALAVSECST